MFERFTAQARRAIALAQEQARALRHDYVGTEHLLLGLLAEQEGLAGEVLRSLGVTLQQVRERVVEMVGRGEAATRGNVPFTPRTKRVLKLSLRECLDVGGLDIGTEHVLLGLAREDEGVAARILLVSFGLDGARIRKEVLDWMHGDDPAQSDADEPSRVARRGSGGTGVSGTFFERPVPEPEPDPEPSPPWTGPPHGVLPGVAALELVLAANDRAAVYVGRCAAYPTGLELEVRVLVRGDDLDPSLNGIYHRPGGGSTYEEMLRFGIEFSDGRRATNVGGSWPGTDEPTGPVLWGMGGSGGGGRWEQDFWVWPLPPRGPVGLVCEWPAAGIALGRQEIDAQVLLDAAARARSLFGDETSHHASNWTSVRIARAQSRVDHTDDH